MLRTAFVACAAAALLAAFAPSASSAPRPPVIPAVAQYIEVLPTSGGPAVPSGHRRTPLPAHVARELGTSPQDKLLRAVATSSAYGAPQHRPHAKKDAADVRHASVKPSVAVSRSALGASVNAVGTGRDVVVWLGVVLLVITAAGAGAAVSRARQARR